MSIEKWKLEEKIKLSYLRHRGNELRVINELGLDVEYVRKVIRKIKSKQNRDQNVMICNTLASHILLGYESRISILQETLHSLAGKNEMMVSTCCKYPVYKLIKDSNDLTEHNTCSRCNKNCNTMLLTRDNIYELELKILDQLREEDELLIRFMEKMKFTATGESNNQINKTTNNIFYMNDKKNKSAEPLDAEIIKETNDLKPADVQRLIQGLENKIIDDISEGE